MVEHKCLKCNKIFGCKSNYIRHINRKKPCDHVLVNPENICQVCNKKFKDYSGLYKHMKKNNCSILINDYKLENNVQNNNVNNIQNVQNIDKQINQTITIQNAKILKFGEEDLSHIKDDVYKKLLNSGFKSVPKFIEHVHFNTLNPDNHNIYISNLQNSYILIYDGEKWEIKDKDDVIEDLMQTKTELLLEKFDELINDLPKTVITKFQRFIDKKDHDNVINKIKKDIKLILYNNRSLPMSIRNTDEDVVKIEKLDNIVNELEKLDINKLDKIKLLLGDL